MSKKNKKKISQKERIERKKLGQAISRKSRNQVRSAVSSYYLSFRNFNVKHLLFVMKDTENMETVLLQRVDIGNGKTLLMLPSISMDMINEYFDSSQLVKTNENSVESSNAPISNLIQHYYSIKSDNVATIDQANMIVFRECKVVGNTNLVPLNVRPYNLNKWYCAETTSIDAVKIFSGKKLKTFFNFSNDEECLNTYILHDTIIEILLYKAMMNKINATDLAIDIQQLARSNNKGLYAVLATNIGLLLNRFKNEEAENEELNKVKELMK